MGSFATDRFVNKLQHINRREAAGDAASCWSVLLVIP